MRVVLIAEVGCGAVVGVGAVGYLLFKMLFKKKEAPQQMGGCRAGLGVR